MFDYLQQPSIHTSMTQVVINKCLFMQDHLTIISNALLQNLKSKQLQGYINTV